MDQSTQAFTKEKRTKLVPFSTPHNMASQNPEETWSNLLKQQTKFLKDQFGIPVAGAGTDLYQILPNNRIKAS
jgi:hypothetical protein